MKDLLKRLCETWGPSGYEHKVRKVIESEIAAYADDVRIDGIGNLIARVGTGGTRVMVIAHMDEIGVMATYAETATGVLRFAEIGGLTKHALLGKRVQFEDGTIGVIGVHDMYKKTDPKLDDLYIDTGGVEVRIGQPAAFAREFSAQGEVYIGKAMDNRAGCVVAIEAIQRLNKHTANEVHFVFSVQEEVGLRGAGPAAFGVDPDIAVAVDVTDTGDLPKGEKMAVRLGGGAAIKVHDPGLVVPRAIIDWMVSRAEADGIPYQMELMREGSQDAARVQNTRVGVPSGCISIPTRYIHSPSEMVHQADLQACADLLIGLLKNPIEP
jgi:tetrahedral aminopeptidase